MIAWLLSTDARIAPFGDHPRDLPVLGEPLRDLQERALARVGCEVRRVQTLSQVDRFPCLLLHDDLVFTARLVRRFLRRARSPARLGLEDSAWLRSARPLLDLPERGGGVVLPFWRLDGPEDLERLDSLPVLSLEPAEWTRKVDLPPQFQAAAPEVVLSSMRVQPVRHWVHLLRANLDGIGGIVREGFDERPVRSVLHFLLALLLRPFWRLAMVPRGRGCRVHRTAVVEACRLGSRVTVGAHAVVRGSVLGDGVQVGDGAHVTASVLGPGAAVGPNCVVFASLLMERAFCGHRLTQASILGRDALTTGGGYLVDFNWGQEIQVRDGEALRGSGTPFLGACLGHRVKMGTGVWVGAGRALPNDTVVVRDPDGVLRRVPDAVDPEATCTVRGGSLVPLAQREAGAGLKPGRGGSAR